MSTPTPEAMAAAERILESGLGVVTARDEGAAVFCESYARLIDTAYAEVRAVVEAAEAYREAEAAYVAASQVDDDPHKELTACQYAESRLFTALAALKPHNEGSET